MKKIVATVISMSDDSLYTQFYCIGDDGTYDDAVSSTLCRAVGDLIGPELDDFLDLLDAAARGAYPSGAADAADVSTDSTNIWLRPLHTLAGHVLIKNATSFEPGEAPGPRLFTHEQVRVTARLAVKFEAELTTQGEENLLGQRIEADLPD